MERNRLGLAIKELCLKKGIKQTELAKSIGMSNTSLSQIVTGKARPREVNFSKLCQELCETPEEEKSLVDAFVRLDEATPEMESDKTPEIDASELERAERYLERKTQAIAFKRSVAVELEKSEITFRKDYIEGIYTTDFLLNLNDERIAVQCKFNLLRDFEKTNAIAHLILENLNCSRVYIVVPFITEGQPHNITNHKISLLNISQLIERLRKR